MQNSGLGNTVNPLLSLASEEVYSIPILLLIGWRGEPGVKDEPQHIHQGRVTPDLLETMDIPYIIIDSDMSQDQIKNSILDQIDFVIIIKNQYVFLSEKEHFIVIKRN